jgi:hypothetical protein
MNHNWLARWMYTSWLVKSDDWLRRRMYASRLAKDLNWVSCWMYASQLAKDRDWRNHRLYASRLAKGLASGWAAECTLYLTIGKYYDWLRSWMFASRLAEPLKVYFICNWPNIMIGGAAESMPHSLSRIVIGWDAESRVCFTVGRGCYFACRGDNPWANFFKYCSLQ